MEEWPRKANVLDWLHRIFSFVKSFEAKWNSSIYYWNKNEIFHSSKQLIFFFLEFSIVTFRNLWCCTLKFSLMRAFSWHRLAINLQLSPFLFTGNKLYLPTPFSNSVTLVTSFCKIKTILKAWRKDFNFGATLFQVVQHKSSVYQNDELSWDCRKIEREISKGDFLKACPIISFPSFLERKQN